MNGYQIGAMVLFWVSGICIGYSIGVRVKTPPSSEGDQR